jgi:hypothetical protein
VPTLNPHIYEIKHRTKVHNKIIDSKGRRKTTKTNWINKTVRQKKELWGKNGEVIHNPKVITSDLINLRNNSSIMILGPGKGAEVLFMSKFIKSRKPQIDTLGLGNQLTEDAKAVIRKDYSPGLEKIKPTDLFEHFNHLKFVRKYDYIYSAYGPALHTKYHEITILKIASMLKPGGFARILPWFNDIDSYNKNIKNVKDYLKETGHADALDIEFEENSLIIRRVK